MKPETKKSLFFLFITITYLLQAINDNYDFSFVYFFGFMVAVTVLYVISNKYIGVLIGLIILLAMEFYDTNYKQLTIIAFLLISAHKNLMPNTFGENKAKISNVFSFFCVQTSIFLTIALYIYDFVLISNHTVSVSSLQLSSTVMIFLWLIGIFIYSFFNNKNNTQKKKNHKISKHLSDSLRFLYLVSFFGFLATVLLFFASTSNINIGYREVFFPWFVFICSMVYNDDPYILSIAKSIDNLLTAISNKDKVK